MQRWPLYYQNAFSLVSLLINLPFLHVQLKLLYMNRPFLALLLSAIGYSPISAQWQTSAAVVDFAGGNLNDFTNLLNNILQSSSARSGIQWRQMTVQNYDGNMIPAETETLWRWDSTPPEVIFANGFVPRVVNYPNDNNMNLYTYVNQNDPSIFVSTTHSVRTDGYFWRPRNINNKYRYEIYAPGGIDVNLSLDEGDNGYPHQNEIAFPGGIRPEFIRSARCYDNNGRIIKFFRNGAFQPLNSNIPNRDRGCRVPTQWIYPGGSDASSYSTCSARNTREYGGSNSVQSNDFCSYINYTIEFSSISFVDPGNNVNEPYGSISVKADNLDYTAVETVWQRDQDDATSISQQLANVPSQEVKGIVPQVCFRGHILEDRGWWLWRDTYTIANDFACGSNRLDSQDTIQLHSSPSETNRHVGITYYVRKCTGTCAQQLLCSRG